MNDIVSRLCTYCNLQKHWIWNGEKLKDGSKIYTDSTLKRWAGRRCPDCEKKRVQEAIRCDNFEKKIIISQFRQAGYEIISKTLPIKVKKNDKILTVGIKRAYTENGQIVLESETDRSADIHALVFESVRICDSTQMNRLTPNIQIFDKKIISEEHLQQIN